MVKSPCELPPGFNSSEVGVGWEDDLLPKVDKRGWEEESSAPDPVLGEEEDMGSLI